MRVRDGRSRRLRACRWWGRGRCRRRLGCAEDAEDAEDVGQDDHGHDADDDGRVLPVHVRLPSLEPPAIARAFSAGQLRTGATFARMLRASPSGPDPFDPSGLALISDRMICSRLGERSYVTAEVGP